MIICKDRTKFYYGEAKRKEAKRKIDKSLKRNYHVEGKEYPYINVKPRIIAEQYMEEAATQGENWLTDYDFLFRWRT